MLICSYRVVDMEMIVQWFVEYRQQLLWSHCCRKTHLYCFRAVVTMIHWSCLLLTAFILLLLPST